MSAFERIKDEYFSEEWVCEFLGLSKKAMQCRRCEGRDHPPYIKDGRKVFYPAQEFHTWFKKKRVLKEIA